MFLATARVQAISTGRFKEVIRLWRQPACHRVPQVPMTLAGRSHVPARGDDSHYSFCSQNIAEFWNVATRPTE
jgi:hypothetical protein